MPEVTWMRNGKSLAQSSKIRMYSEATSHALTLHDVSASDMGVYTCRAFNAAGVVDCRSTLRMGGGHFDLYSHHPAADDSAHFVQLPESTMTVRRDQDLIIECRVRGHPRPKGFQFLLLYKFLNKLII